jgi:hypothetical protein
MCKAGLQRQARHQGLQNMSLHFLITSTPPGEAPLWVREQRVGLVLPLAQTESSRVTLKVAGVLSGPRRFIPWPLVRLLCKYKKESGYIVEARHAIKILSEYNPKAGD